MLEIKLPKTWESLWLEYDQYLWALIAFFAITLSIRFIKRIIRHWKPWAQATESQWDDFLIDLIENISWVFGIAIGIYAAQHVVSLPSKKWSWFDLIFIGGVTYQIGLFAQVAVRHVAQYLSRQVSQDSASLLQNMKSLVVLLIWVIGGLFSLHHVGYNISSFLTGLGIGGIAIAFALQNTLSDLFSAFSILFDKPFKNGDVIMFGQEVGTVLRTGFKTTRLSTIRGEELIISNNDLLKERIKNFARMERRRVVFRLGIEYTTPLEKIQQTKHLLIETLKAQPTVTLERVHLVELGAFSLNFEACYSIPGNDHSVYLEIQEAIYLELLSKLAVAKIQIAFPTQTIHLPGLEHLQAFRASGVLSEAEKRLDLLASSAHDKNHS